jgi:hypothetical protein
VSATASPPLPGQKPRRSPMRTAGVALAIMGVGGASVWGINEITRPRPVSEACQQARLAQLPNAEEICRTTSSSRGGGATVFRWGGGGGGSAAGATDAGGTGSVSRGGFGGSAASFSSSGS